MRIGIIGAGNVGGTLGKGWARRGHEVFFGVRRPDDPKVRAVVSEAGPAARAGSVSEAAAFGECLAVTTPWEATREALESAGPLAGKILLDCTNPLRQGLSALDQPEGKSAAERIAAWCPGARVVKIFNSAGWNVMANPRFGDEASSMLFCGDDAEAKRTAARLAADLGFEPQDTGPLSEAAHLEHLALLWIRLAVVRGFGREIGFRLLRRERGEATTGER